MPAIQRFEDIEAWQMARELTRAVYRLTNEGRFAQDYALRDQIRRATISITANIAEGYERNGNQEFIQFLYIAKASTGEVRSHLYLDLDQGYLEQATFDTLCGQAVMIGRKLQRLIESLHNSPYKGVKYRT